MSNIPTCDLVDLMSIFEGAIVKVGPRLDDLCECTSGKFAPCTLFGVCNHTDRDRSQALTEFIRECISKQGDAALEWSGAVLAVWLIKVVAEFVKKGKKLV